MKTRVVDGQMVLHSGDMMDFGKVKIRNFTVQCPEAFSILVHDMGDDSMHIELVREKKKRRKS